VQKSPVGSAGGAFLLKEGEKRVILAWLSFFTSYSHSNFQYMKTPLRLAFAALLASPFAASAQSAITLSQNTFPAAAGTVERYQDAYFSGTAPVTPTGANQTWDYRNLVPTGNPYTLDYLPVPAGSPFAAAQWTRARSASVGVLSYSFTSYYALNSTGRLGLGRTLTRQARGISTLTGGANDSVVISRQTIPFIAGGGTTPFRDIPLPLTAGSRVASTLRFATVGTLTVASAGYNRAPFRIVQRVVQVDSVAGWGTVRVPVAGNSAGSPALAVLQVRERIVMQDSMYLNGAPAPATLLAALGITQGRVTAYYSDLFFRNGSAQPALDLYYPNAAFGRPTAADYSTEASLLASRTPAAAAGLALVPNPSAANAPVVLAAANGRSEALRLTVRDMLGRPVANAAARTNEPTRVLDGLPAGTYLLEAQNSAGSSYSFRLVRE